MKRVLTAVAIGLSLICGTAVAKEQKPKESEAHAVLPGDDGVEIKSTPEHKARVAEDAAARERMARPLTKMPKTVPTR